MKRRLVIASRSEGEPVIALAWERRRTKPRSGTVDVQCPDLRPRDPSARARDPFGRRAGHLDHEAAACSVVLHADQVDAVLEDAAQMGQAPGEACGTQRLGDHRGQCRVHVRPHCPRRGTPTALPGKGRHAASVSHPMFMERSTLTRAIGSWTGRPVIHPDLQPLLAPGLDPQDHRTPAEAQRMEGARQTVTW